MAIKLYRRIIYTHISIITNLANTFKKVINKMINGYLKHFNIISSRQFGFQEKKSTIGQDAIGY